MGSESGRILECADLRVYNVKMSSPWFEQKWLKIADTDYHEHDDSPWNEKHCAYSYWQNFDTPPKKLNTQTIIKKLFCAITKYRSAGCW